MNMRVFVITATVVAFVLVALVCVRVGMDGVSHTAASLRALDEVAGYALSVLGFVISLSVLVCGGDPPGNGIALLLLGILASSLIWGVVVERVFRTIRKKPA